MKLASTIALSFLLMMIAFAVVDMYSEYGLVSRLETQQDSLCVELRDVRQRLVMTELKIAVLEAKYK